MITPSKQTITTQKPASIQQMFDSIAPTYDILNHLMSFGMDILWRKQAISYLVESQCENILDIAAGSGDVSFELARYPSKKIIASDFSQRMLEVLQQKMQRKQSDKKINFICCDALSLPFESNTFDATIVAFGIRNFADRLVSLREMHRVLKPDGITIILELTMPTNPVMLQLYKIHSRCILPILGKIISRHLSAYTYLPDSIASFPTNDEFLLLMRTTGFTDTEALPLTFGTATIFKGIKS